MKASKIVHKNENRIKIDFPFNREIASKLKKIPDAKWSKTLNSWHIPYNKSAFELLKNLFPEIEYPHTVSWIKNSASQNAPISLKNPGHQEYKKPYGVSIMVFGRKIAVKLPKNEIDTRFLLGLRYSKWEGKQFCWIVPNYPGNLDLIKDYFKERITELEVHEEFETNTGDNTPGKIGKDDLLIIKTIAGRLKIFFGYNKELTKAIKNIPYNSWNVQNKWWSIPFSDKFLQEIRTLASAQNLNLIYEEEEKDNNKKARVSPFDIPNYRPCPDEYILKLKELRYSAGTLKTYKGLFEEFINY